MSDLIAQLQAAGEVEARGGFTIDPEKAREKLRQYQLAEPHRYVLLLVEAAVSTGAAELEFEIDSDDLHLRFTGAVFAYDQLENIYGSLFMTGDELGPRDELQPVDLARLRGLQQLAYALNSAMALNPRFARVVSVAEDGTGTALELHPDSPDLVEAVEGQAPGNHIHVKDRIRPGLLVEFFRYVNDTLTEIVLLREHCRWSRTPIFVNGELISGPMKFADEHWTAVDIVDGEQRIGRAVIGLQREASSLEPARLHLLSNGVYIESAILDERAVPGFGAIVDSQRFGKDVSQTKLLRDAGYDQVVAATLAAQDRLIHRLAERRVAETAPPWTDGILRCFMLVTRLTKPKYKRLELREMLDEDEVFAAVCAVPMWPVIGADPVSTRTLIESEGPVRHASQDFEFAPVDVPFVLRNPSAQAMELLTALFGDHLYDYTPAMRREAERQRHRLAFMMRKHLPELGEGYFLVREPIVDTREEISIQGELGLRSLGHHDSWIRLLSEGCLLQELALDGPIPGLGAVVQTTFEPNETYETALPNDTLASALIAVLEALARALAALCRAGTITAQHTELRAMLRIYVHQVCRRDYAVAFLAQFGYSRREANRQLTRLGIQDSAHFGVGPSSSPAREAHPIFEVPLYERAHGSPCSLARLAERRADDQRLAWLESGQGPLPPLDDEVLLLDKPDREALRELFGNDALAPYAERLVWLQRRAAFLERPKTELALRHAALVEVSFESDDPVPLRGALGLREFAFTAASEGDTPIAVHYCARELEQIELELPLPGLTAWVDSEAFELSSHFEALAHPASLRRSLLHALVELTGAVLERVRTRPGDALRCERWFLLMIPSLVLGGGGLARTLAELYRELGRERALAELSELLELLERYPERDLNRVSGRLRGRQTTPRAAAVRDELKRPTRRLTQAERDLLIVRRGLAPLLDPLLQLPLFCHFELGVREDQATRSSLDQLLTTVAGGEPLSWVGDDFRIESMPSVELEILSLDAIEQWLLERLLGGDALELVSEWLLGRARFERRKTISEIRVARGSTIALLRIDDTHEDVRGELGISHQAPSQIHRSRIRVFTESRQVATVDFPARPVALVGALELDSAELNTAHDDLSDAAREDVRRFALAQVDALLIELAERFPQLDGGDKTRAAEIVRHLLHEWPPGSGGYQARSNKRRGLFKRLAELPVFAGARKPWSAFELAEASERERIAVLAYRRPKLELPDVPVVVLDSPDVETTLRALYGKVRDLDRELERERAIAKRKDAAPAMPSEPPAEALIRTRVDGEGLRGWLWLTTNSAEVMFGEHGKAAAQRVVSTMYWCTGAIWGPGLSIAKDWSRVIVTRPQERLLERLACQLWDQLIDEFIARSEAPAAPDDDEARALFVAIRDALHELFHRLHASYGHRRRGKTRKKKRKKKRGNRDERVYARLCELPLLQLSNGHWISADVAERERPIELASLELWTGPSAEELAHARAVERREAERERERQRREQREHEAKRRRAEAEAREREAERRRRAQAEAREREAREREARERAERREAEAKPKTKAEDKPKKKPKREAPRAPLPEELLLEALREELRLVRDSNSGLVSNRILDSLVLGEPKRRGPLFRHEDERVEINVSHALFEDALAGYLDDPGLLTLLASAAYSYLNVIHRTIEDHHEAEFLQLHAAYAGTDVG